MKFCPDCGEKLPKATPKHCPECGITLSLAKEQAQPEASGLLKSVPRKYFTYAGIALLLLVALFISYGVADYSSYSSKKVQDQQKAQMQLSVLQHKEELQRQQIQADTARKMQLASDLKRYSMAAEYTKSQIGALASQYADKNISDKNIDEMIEGAKKMVLLFNTYISESDGMRDYMLENKGLIIFLIGVSEANFTAGMKMLDQEKAGLQKAKESAIQDFEKYAGTDKNKQAKVAEVLAMLREGESA